MKMLMKVKSQMLMLMPQYLGNDLEDIRGRTVYEDGAEVMLPLLPLPGMPVPGQVIPLHLFQQHLVAALRSIADSDKTFGIVTYSSTEGDEQLSALSQIGCTAEIFSMKDERDESTGLSTLRAKARGRQRFKVLEMHREITGIVMAKVQILPELSFSRCLDELRPSTHNKFCFNSMQKHILFKYKMDRFACALLSYWPDWVYKMYDKDVLKSQVVNELYTWNESFQSVSLPTEAADLSFWVVQNLPLDNNMRIHLMSLNCTVQRLQTEIHILRKCTIFCCATCMVQIARKEDVFSMSEEGPLSAYVNPGGHVHETLTVSKARNLHLIGRSSSEHSWFPGYSWTIAQCDTCNSHMGWRFTSMKKNFWPSKFWGLCRSSLVPELQANDRGHEEQLQG
ncbi:protein cereblon-like isoform X2 [Pomacea canaliculata]|uniref:protein cereblon-like isoform X2 n=1 Tax=Pomacea canaliculata TaxID=400727 RepID=UPI000D73B022|nr:protein cereblon-like isoform X2 [Pomacea canaliculata]